MDSKLASAVVVQKGQEASPDSQAVKPNQKVIVKTWRNEEDRERSVRSTIRTGRGQISEDVEKIILQMKKGDVWQIKLNNHATQKEDVVWIEILDSTDETTSPPLPPFEQASQLKAEGNAAIKDKKYVDSIKAYERAYHILEYSCDPASVELRLSIESNLALATLSVGKFQECLDWCAKHTRESLEPNKKVIYRQASAEKELREWEKAKKTIEVAIEYWKGDEAVLKDFTGLRAGIERDEKEQMKKEKKVYSNMFG